MKKLLDINFTSPTALGKRTLRKSLLIRQNLEEAVKQTVLYGISLIQGDTPVDTGLLRASIAGQFGDGFGALTGAGRSKSLTRLSLGELLGIIGTAVEYAAHVEFGWRIAVQAVTGRRYYKRGADGKVKRVPGRAMFRKNLPVIRRYFRERCQTAVRNGLRGQSMGGEG